MRWIIAWAAALAFAATAIAADVYPVKPVRIVVPFPPGGPADVLARTVGDELQASLGQPVVVDNRPGAGGNIGMELVAKAAADGHTLVLAPAGNLTVNPSLYRSVPYDVARDFAPVTVIAAVPNLRALGVGSAKRMASAPALPTLDESGLAGFDVTSWYSIPAPAATLVKDENIKPE
jgi:tripartite-type tricarboxylate transporter receptor subunit TctC